MNVSRAGLRLAAPLAAGLVALACGEGSAPPRGAFAAAWLAADSAPPTSAELTRLAAAGVQELFVEAARVGGTGDRPRLEPLALRELARHTPATLVVTGRWPSSARSAGEIAGAWRETLEGLLLTAQSAGVVAVGVHFDLALAGDSAALADVLRRLRRELRGRLFVSVALPRAGLDDEQRQALATAVDFVVLDLFGQAPDEPDDPRRWDLAATEAALAAAERLGVRYAVAAWTLGAAELRPAAAAAATPIRGGLPLARWLRSPAFAPRPGAVFAGIDRQVFELEAREPTALGAAAIGRGAIVRVTRPTTHDLEELLAVLAAHGGTRRVGVVLKRLPAADDNVSLGPASLAAAFEPGDAEPELKVGLISAGGSRGRVAFRVRLENRSAEATDLGGGDWNFVELSFGAGALGRVDPGDFAGWEQLWRGLERRTLRALREADTLRLFAPFVGAGERLESGVVELRGTAGERPAVEIAGRFILPGGRELRLAATPAEWIVGD